MEGADKNWFANLPKDQCERLLVRACANLKSTDVNDHGHKFKGVFLVRKGSESSSPYVLMCYDSECNHYRIFQYENCAFFSLDKKKMFKGLDELIECYQKNLLFHTPTVDLTLYKPVYAGSSPPAEHCAVGNGSPLHDAIKNADVRLAIELLNENPRLANYKNASGRTPLHLACSEGDDELLKITQTLIVKGSNLFSRDKHGETACIIACRNNNVKSVRAMINHDVEIVQERKSQINDSPLHIGARWGHSEVVKLLLDNDALIHQMNEEGKYPLDLAVAQGNADVIRLLSTAVPKLNPEAIESNWRHGELQRGEAERILRSSESESRRGVFLVRYSVTRKNFVLSLMCDDDMYHYDIKQSGTIFSLNKLHKMTSLEELISHHMRFRDGLLTKLITPVKPNTVTNSEYDREKSVYTQFKRSLSDQEDCGTTYDQIDSNSVQATNDGTTYAQIDSNSVQATNDGYVLLETIGSSTAKNNALQFYQRDDLMICGTLGVGNFGVVNYAILKTRSDLGKVAVKSFKSRNDSVEKSPEEFSIADQERCSILREAGIMMNFDHEHIVKLIGVIDGDPLQLIHEFMPLGSLKDYLVNSASHMISNDDCINWSYQIANGMRYLEKKRVVHRDLAARNILLARKDLAKIGDFGLSRTISVENDQFDMRLSPEAIPWSHYAPECFLGIYTMKSDVWSYGVTLWEIFARGLDPYFNLTEEMSEREIIKMIGEGYRLEKTALCSQKIYQEMRRCWELSPELRPKMMEFVNFFGGEEENAYMDMNGGDRDKSCMKY